MKDTEEFDKINSPLREINENVSRAHKTFCKTSREDVQFFSANSMKMTVDT